MKKNLYINTILFFLTIFTFLSCSKDGAMDSIGGTGTGGSLARFTISGQYLYVVNGNSLKTFSISNPNSIALVSEIGISNDIETIYPYNGNLFIGSATAMYIFSLADPANPKYESMASHVRACDPVVAKDSIAYVTVRSMNNGSPCGGTRNALMIFNVNDISQPILLNEISLSNPHGLGVKSNYLYICDDASGLKVFNVNNPSMPQLLTSITGYNFYDVIPYNDILICMVSGGMVIYDIEEPASPIFVAATF